MLVSIHQPDYLPYLGYFYKIAKSDIFVFLDDAQFSNDNMHHWNRIKTSQGECRLKIPVKYKFGDRINEVLTKDELLWEKKHLKTIEMNYIKADFFNEIFPQLEALLLSSYDNLATMNIELIQWICLGFGMDAKFIRSSEMNIKASKQQRIIDICISLGCETYLSGNGARAYQSEENFSSNGIKLEYTNYKPIEYKQLWGDFLPNMSILDYLFNYGFSWEYIDRALKGE